MQIKDLNPQTLRSLSSLIPKLTWNDQETESFMTEELDVVEKKVISDNKGHDTFLIFNKTDGFFAYPEELSFKDAINYVQKFHRRYDFQKGMYRDRDLNLIKAIDVELSIQAYIEPE